MSQHANKSIAKEMSLGPRFKDDLCWAISALWAVGVCGEDVHE